MATFHSLVLPNMSAGGEGALSSINLPIEGVPPLNDSHYIQIKLMPLFHINFAKFHLNGKVICYLYLLYFMCVLWNGKI